jgi:hypothetical protein
LKKLDQAQTLLSQGMYILPVTRDKVPLVKGGYSAASNDPIQIEAWKKEFPNCTWGIRTGIVSGIVVVDLDPRNGSAQTVVDLRKQGHTFPDTSPMISTPQKGTHFYFKYPSENTDTIINSHTNLLPGLDILGEGKFVMAPGSESIHGTYSRTPIDLSKLPEVPQWVLDLIKDDSAVLQTSSTSSVTPLDTKGILSTASCRFIAEGSSSWNDALFKAAKDCFEQGYSLEETLTKLEPATRSQPEYLGYFDKKDLKTIESAFSKAPRYEPRILAERSDREGYTSDNNSNHLHFSKRERHFENDSQGLAHKGDVHAPESPIVTAETLFGEVSTFLTEKKTIGGVGTGLQEFDKLLGGLRPGELTAIHAEGKSGKSTFIHKLIHCLLKQGHSVGYASREMDPKEEVMPSLLSLQGQYNAWKEPPKLSASDVPWLSHLYFSPGYGYFPLNELIQWFSQMAEKQVKIIFYDHLHFGLANPEEHKDTALYIRELKTLARKFGMSIIVVIQANKMMDGTRLSKNTIKGGSAIGQTINTLFTLERLGKNSPYLDAENVTKIELVDKRHTQSKYGEFFLRYNEETTDLEPVELQDAAQTLGPTYTRGSQEADAPGWFRGAVHAFDRRKY